MSPSKAKLQSLLIRGRMVDSRFRTTKRWASNTAPECGATERAWAAVSVHAKAAPTSVRRPVVVRHIRNETADAVSIEFQARDGRALVFQPGQHLSCRFMVDGQAVQRPYSLTSQPGGDTACITVKRIDQGRVSSYVQSRLEVGDQFEVLPAAGDFIRPRQEPEAYCFIAGGSGITPVLCLIESLLAAGGEAPIHLLYANRTLADVIFLQRLRVLEEAHQRLRVSHVLDTPPPDWSGPAGPMNVEVLGQVLTQPASTHQYYLCGPLGLMQLARSFLLEAGVSAERIVQEEFTAAADSAQTAALKPQLARFKTSGVEVEVVPGETLLEAGLRAGVELEYSCTVGGCGHCKQSVSVGEVQLDEPNCLTAEERAQGFQLLCVGRPLSAVVVDA